MIGANTIINVKRLTADIDSKYSYPSSNHITGLSAYIETVDTAEAVMAVADTDAYQVFQCFIDGIHDIKRNDLIVADYGEEYTVSNVRKFRNNEVPSHMELLLKQAVENG